MTARVRIAERSVVDDLRVARPCFEPWDEMDDVEGEEADRVRHCARCDRHVFNVSALSRAEAAAFLRERTGQRTCVRFYRRADDTVVTSDCPPRRVHLPMVLHAALVTAAVTTAVGGAGAVMASCGVPPVPPGWHPSPVIEAMRAIGVMFARGGMSQGIRAD